MHFNKILRLFSYPLKCEEQWPKKLLPMCTGRYIIRIFNAKFLYSSQNFNIINNLNLNEQIKCSTDEQNRIPHRGFLFLFLPHRVLRWLQSLHLWVSTWGKKISKTQ